MRWYVPSHGGDHRLEPDTDWRGKARSVLIVHDPTPGEIGHLRRFLHEAATRGWIGAKANVVLVGESRIVVKATVAEAGPVLAGVALGDKPGQLTIVKWSDGSYTADVDPAVAATPPAEPSVPLPPEAAAAAAASAAAASAQEAREAAARAEAAATVRRPTHCCPWAQPGDPREARADEVLLTFCTGDQRAQWERDGSVDVQGGTTGFFYRIFHRHHPETRGNSGFIVRDLASGEPLHAWDWRVPPPEEVLACKVILEHKEPWMRHNSSMLGTRGNVGGTGVVGYFKPKLWQDHHRTATFHNPLGNDDLDGTDSAQLLAGLGLQAHMQHRAGMAVNLFGSALDQDPDPLLFGLG
jgi:hypothetical protein